jgi:hypothetical protein
MIRALDTNRSLEGAPIEAGSSLMRARATASSVSLRTRVIVLLVVAACGVGVALALDGTIDAPIRRNSAQDPAVQRKAAKAIGALAPSGVTVRAVSCKAKSISAMSCVAHFTSKYGSGIYTRAVAVDPKAGSIALNQLGFIKFTTGRFAR